MIVGNLWDLGFQSEEGKKGFLSGPLLLTLLFLTGFVLVLFKNTREVLSRGNGLFFLRTFHSLLYAAGVLSLSALFIMRRKWASFVILMVAFAFFHLHLSYSLPSEINSLKSAKGFSEKILKRMEIGDELKTYSLKSNGLLYYTKKPYIESIQSQERFFEIFNSPQRVFVVIYAETLDRLKKETNVELTPLEQVKVNHWKYVLISNH